jgi:integrator complex subunit 2
LSRVFRVVDRREIALRTKSGNAAVDSILVPSLNLAPALEFERSDATRRLRLVLSELILIMGQVRRYDSSS